jgi:hypothetical protein
MVAGIDESGETMPITKGYKQLVDEAHLRIHTL